MGKPRNKAKSYMSQGQPVGDRHESRQSRGDQMIANDIAIKNENYDLSWFKPSQGQTKILQSMMEKDCTLVDGKSGCGKSTTVIWQSLKWLKDGHYRKIIFIKSPTQMGMDDVGFLSSNEAKFDYPLMAMRDIFHSFMSKQKLESEEKKERIQFTFPNWLAGITFSNAIVIIDELQLMQPEIVKLCIERADSSCKVVCMFDAKQRYASNWRKDGATDLLNRVSKVEDGVRYITEPLFGYVKLSSSENRRGALSKRITELYDNLDFDNK